MFKNTRFSIFLSGFLFLAITAFFCWLCADSECVKKSSYWYTVIPVFLAEIMIVLSCTDLGGNHKDKGLLYRIGNLAVSVPYFIFTLLAVLMFAADFGKNTILAIHLFVLFFVVILQIFFVMANNSVSAGHKSFSDQRINRNFFRMELESIQMENLVKISDAPELKKALDHLTDTVICSPESLPGCSEIDLEVSAAIAGLKAGFARKTTAELIEDINFINALLRKRRIIVQSLR